jgi:preprotein translocase subunit SecD
VATQTSRPGRTLLIFGGVLLVLLALVAIGNTWKPRLGLDLQGGTRITLQAQVEGGSVTTAKLAQAKTIITQRVNGTGTTASEVTTRGKDQIIVEVPGEERSDIVEQVGRTAQLRFRLVWAGPAAGSSQPPAPPDPGTGEEPGAGAGGGGGGGAGGGAGGGGAGNGAGGAGGGGASNRAAAGWMLRADGTQEGGGAGAGDGDGGGNGGGAGNGAGTGEEAPATPGQPEQKSLDDISLQESIDTELSGTPPAAYTDDYARLTQKFAEFTCPDDPDAATQVEDVPSKPLITCDDEGAKYLLSPAVIEGTSLDDASAVPPNQNPQWVVSLDLDSEGSSVFSTVTKALNGLQKPFAIVLDGQVLSAPVVNSPITNGNAEISGGFDQESASDLANSLRYGALPLTFVINGVDLLGPSLAGSQLAAGVLAGVIGVSLVVIYCMLYYRGLGLVVVASLAVAALLTYEMVILLGNSVGFALNLPGIAGLIVAVGITADSFIIYFERIRDEARDGKSLRLAVEAGWKRARNTCLAADAVSFLAAVVLYVFAIDEVRGFAFTLGLSTVIDVIVFFFFTKPLVTLLARTKFFGQGHKLSGLDAAQLGIRGRAVTQVARTPRGAY